MHERHYSASLNAPRRADDKQSLLTVVVPCKYIMTLIKKIRLIKCRCDGSPILSKFQESAHSSALQKEVYFV